MNLIEIYNTDKIRMFKRSLRVSKCTKSNCINLYTMHSLASRFPYHYIEKVMGVSKKDLYDIAVKEYNGYVSLRGKDYVYFTTEEDCKEYINYIKGIRLSNN